MSACPDPETFRQLLEEPEGTVRLIDLESHLDQCPTCLQRLAALSRENAIPLVCTARESLVHEDSDEIVAHLSAAIPCPEELCHPGQFPGDPGTDIPTISGFEQLQLIGRGGSGDVYKAWQASENQWVALKIVNSARSLGRASRLELEAQILSRLNHPHIVRIHGTGEHDGQPFLAMEWITGGSLREYLRRGRLPIQQAVQLAQQVASALEAVHALGIVHRDLKPANVLLGVSGPDSTVPHAKLTDFSIARDHTNRERQTSTGMVVGTPQYMSPEQTGLSQFPGVVGPASDIYGVGALLYDCLTGQPPHSGDTSFATLSQVASADPVPPGKLRTEIPPDLETIVVKCLRKNPADRYRTAGELAEDLRLYLAGRPISARPYTWGERLVRWFRQRPVAGTALAMLGLLLLSGLVGILFHLRSTQTLLQQLARQKQEAEGKAQQASRQALFASGVLLEGETLTPAVRQRMVQELRENQLNGVNLETLSVEQAELLGGSLFNLTIVEMREAMLDLHQQDTERIVAMARRFPDSLPLRRCAALCLVEQHRLQLQQQQLAEAAQSLTALTSLGDLEPNEVGALLQSLRNQATWESEHNQSTQAVLTLDKALQLAGKHLSQNPTDPHRWGMLLDIQFRRGKLAQAVSDGSNSADPHADWKASLQQLQQAPHEPTLEASLGLQKIWEHACQGAISIEDISLARSLLQNGRATLAEIRQLAPDSSAGIMHTLEFSQLLLRLSKEDRLTQQELAECLQSLDLARNHLQHHPREHGIVAVLSWTLLHMAHYHLAHDEAQEAENRAREVLDLLTPLSRRPLPFPDLPTLVAEAHFLISEALRSTPRVLERRLNLESAYRLADTFRKPAIARELVLLHLQEHNLTAATQVLDWIPPGSPEHDDAQARLRQARENSSSPQP